MKRVSLFAYRFRWLGLDDELVLLKILRKCELHSYTSNAAGGTLNVIFMVAVEMWMS